MEFNNIVEHLEDLDGEQAVNEETPQPDPTIWAEVLQHFENPAFVFSTL